jgi:hypothetical protein
MLGLRERIKTLQSKQEEKSSHQRWNKEAEQQPPAIQDNCQPSPVSFRPCPWLQAHNAANNLLSNTKEKFEFD